MGSGLSLKVPEADRTMETGRRFYQFHVERSQYHDSLDDYTPYRNFVRTLRESDLFLIYHGINNDIVAAAPPGLRDMLDEHTENGHRFTDREGMEALSAWLEDARVSLAAADELDEGLDKTVSVCRHMIEFALEHDYDIAYSF